jgi:DNA polymerase sigma
MKNYVGIKMYGSMASGLAIDSSDVDLAVTGLDFQGNRDLHLREMNQLKQELSIINCVKSINFIDSATIPVIKLSIDL